MRAAQQKLRELEAAEAAFEAEQRLQIEAGTKAQHDAERARCADGIEGCIYWFNTWVWTYNPKLIGQKDAITGTSLTPFTRFLLFPRQAEVLRWIHERVEAGEQGAVKKSRDIG